VIWAGNSREKKKKEHWNKLPPDLEFLAQHPPGKERTVEDQLKIDKILVGMCIYTIDEDGKKTRINPYRTIIEYSK
jgi:hypothetical protein